MHASCESPWYLSAKHHVLEACFLLMVPFRTRFSPCEMVRTANVQRLRGCLYTLRYCYILTCRLVTAQYLLPTPLRILQEASRVHNGGLKQNAVGGVLLKAPSPLWGSPIFLQGRFRLTWSPITDHPMQSSLVLTLHKTFQARRADIDRKSV